MKKNLFLPLLALVCGVAGFLLRTLFFLTGFEPDTGLPVSGNLFMILFWILLLAAAVFFLLRGRTLPTTAEGSFTDCFSTENVLYLTLVVMGLFLWAAAGLYSIYQGLILYRAFLMALPGLLSLVAAASLFPVLPACRRKPDTEPASFQEELLLVPVICMVARLLLLYRDNSSSPFLNLYVVQVLAFAFLILGLFSVASFAFQSGKPRRLPLYAGLGILLSLSAVADGFQLSNLLFHLGSTCLLLGFFLMAADCSAASEKQ